ncbi:ATP-binding protein [Shewanella decolorationis]|uniref:ATP-binding protein n=1 Tax=Shewanella decolorationis TaxID=256839 RepID=UPI001056F02A|nr:ATP-binding protein [Shewanella decolorationis]
MLAVIKNHNKPIKKHRLLFLLYCITIGLLANLSVVSFPIAVPFNVGNVAILVILARLGPIWALICFLFVTYPLPYDITITSSILQVILFYLYNKFEKINLLTASLIYFISIAILNRLMLPEAITDKYFFLLIFTTLATALFAWSIKAANLLLALYVNAQQLRKQSLQHQLSYRVGLYTAIPATLLITLGLNGISSLHLVKQIAIFQDEVSILNKEIEAKLKNYVDKIETITNLTDIQLTKNTLKQLVEQSPEFISALVTDKNGLVREFYKANLNENRLNNESVADRPYFYQVKKSNTSFLSDTFMGRALGEDQLFAVSTPIKIDNQFSGVLQLAIKLDSLLKVFSNRNDSISHRILLDSSGKKVWGSNISGEIGSIWVRPNHSLPMENKFLTNSLFNPLKPITFSKDAHHLIISEDVSNSGWSLYFFIDTDDLFLIFSIYFLLALLLITLILEISIQFSKRFVKHYTQALEQLVDYTQQWDGKSSVRKNLTFTQSALEIDTLAHSFVNMQRRVSGAHHAIISTMNEVRLLNEELEERVENRTKELELERDKANHLASIKTRFLANMSHEIRTPITIIKGFTEQILPKTDGEIHSALCKIEQNTTHLQSIINDILDAAKIDEGKMTIAEQYIDIIPLLESIYESIVMLASSKMLITESEIDVGEIRYVMTDPYRLKQILLNFISNAVKFTHQGKIKLVANINQSNQLYIAIIDEGIGISQEQASNLFQAFTQADSSTSRDFGGTGLGLFISKQLADAMSITLDMQSEPGVGSCFSVTIPESKVTNNINSVITHSHEASDEKYNWENLHILIVDDVKDIRDLIAIYLQETGINLSFAENGQQAVQLVKQQYYDLIILDQQMPIMDGVTAANEIKKFNKKIPLLLLSADILDVESTLGEVFKEKISKPFTKVQLLTTLSKLLNLKEPSVLKNNLLEDDLVIEYLETLPSLMNKLESLIENGDSNNLSRELHKIKGTSACFELKSISQSALKLQNLLTERTLSVSDLEELSFAIKSYSDNTKDSINSK